MKLDNKFGDNLKLWEQGAVLCKYSCECRDCCHNIVQQNQGAYRVKYVGMENTCTKGGGIVYINFAVATHTIPRYKHGAQIGTYGMAAGEYMCQWNIFSGPPVTNYVYI